jgi:hypothetical protein
MRSFEVCRQIAASPATVLCLTSTQRLVSGGPEPQSSFEPFADGLRRLAEGGAR